MRKGFLKWSPFICLFIGGLIPLPVLAQNAPEFDSDDQICRFKEECIRSLFPEIVDALHNFTEIVQHPLFIKQYPELTLGVDQYLSGLISLDTLIQKCLDLLRTSQNPWHDERTIELIRRILSDGYKPKKLSYFETATPEAVLSEISKTDTGKQVLRAYLEKMESGEIGGICWFDQSSIEGCDPAIVEYRRQRRNEGEFASYYRVDRNIYFVNPISLGEGASVLFHEMVHALNHEEDARVGNAIKREYLKHEKELTEVVKELPAGKREEFLKYYSVWSDNTKTLLIPQTLRDQGLQEFQVRNEEEAQKAKTKLRNIMKKYLGAEKRQRFEEDFKKINKMISQSVFVSEAKAYNEQKEFEDELTGITQYGLEGFPEAASYEYRGFLSSNRHSLITGRADRFFIILGSYGIGVENLLGMYTFDELMDYKELYEQSQGKDRNLRRKAIKEMHATIELRESLPQDFWQE